MRQVSRGQLARPTVTEFKRLLIEAPSWVDSVLPIAAKVFECDRFKKD
jgi:hypothetical protein